VGQIWGNLRQVAVFPRKLVLLATGSFAQPLLVAMALSVAPQAFGDHLWLPVLIVVITLAGFMHLAVLDRTVCLAYSPVQGHRDEGVHQDRQDARADQAGGGGGEHHPVLLADVEQGDQQWQRGRGDERHLHPLPACRARR
jgi:hypothetical protein